jgi:hypothetical protein
MTKIQELKTYGKLKVAGFDIAETYNGQGEYTGRYRILHESFPDCSGVRASSATEALRIVALPMAEIIPMVQSL